MASIKDTAATSALNEEQYINKLYDTNLGNQNKVLQENYGNDNAVLDAQQQGVQEQTDQYVQRTDVEARKAADLYGDGGLSAGAQAQVGLSQENAQRRNVQQLREAQNDADVEFQRQRQLLASQFEAAIKQAQADNDMERAQALYDAAKAEDAQLLELQKQGAQLMAKKGDTSIYDSIADGVTLQRDTAGETWDGVLENENALNAIYDAQLESQLAQLRSAYETDASDLEAERKAKVKQTDEQLTDAYVEALKGAKNNAEIQGAYGQGSGTAARGRLARDIDLQDTLTDIRKTHVGSEADAGVQRTGLSKGYGKSRSDAQYDADLERARALFDAAENEEQILVGNQQFVGEQKAKKGDYTMLGKLYGLTDKQIKKLKPKQVTTTASTSSKKSSGSSGMTDDNTGGGGGETLTKAEQAYIIHQSVAKGEITQNQAQALLTQLDRKYPKKES